jgi:exodeoxyribonuclease V gamma subunit
MNDAAWPRPHTPIGFDLMAAQPRLGDRNRRGEERHALLETLLCADDALIVTYTGRDPRSNLELPPAAPLAELIDTLAAMTGSTAETLVLQHPLQPFSRAYFDGSDARLFSHDAEHCPTGSSVVPPPFIADEAAMIGAEGDEIELDALKRFFAHPVKYFLRERLGIRIEEDEGLLDGHEPFVPDRLEAFQLRAAQLAGLDAGQSATETAALLHARGWLPQGVAGTLTARVARAEAEPLWAATAAWRARARPAVEVGFAAAGLHLSGRLEGLSERGLWRVRPGRLRARDRLALWLDHLLLNIAQPPGVALASRLVATDGTFALAPVADAPALLADLLDVFRDGQTRVLPLYPETSWAWQAKKPWARDRKSVV